MLRAYDFVGDLSFLADRPRNFGRRVSAFGGSPRNLALRLARRHLPCMPWRDQKISSKRLDCAERTQNLETNNRVHIINSYGTIPLFGFPQSLLAAFSDLGS